MENQQTRKVIGFDIFGEFPRNLKLESDIKFVDRFEKAGGNGISIEELSKHLNDKGFENYKLVGGDILITLPEFMEKTLL